MEPLFKISQSYTFEEVKKFNKVLYGESMIFVNFGMIIMFLTGILCIILGQLDSHVLFFILFPIFMVIFPKVELNNYYKSNKILQEIIQEYEFYEENFIVKNEMTEFKIGYDKIYKIIETKTNFYIMIAKNQGYIISKSNCSIEAIEFFTKLKSRR